MKSVPVFVSVGIVFLSLGCRRERIQTYRIPKETSSPMALPPAAAGTGIEWKTPPGWKEQPASEMRVGSFLIRGDNGQQADMSVVPLAGDAGGDLANINRWRGQINLPPISHADLSALSEIIRPAGRKMLYVDFVSHETMIEKRYKKRLIAAIYHDPGRTVFFKLLGEDATVLSAKAGFIKFLRSLRLTESKTP